jgi:cytochrome c peroxidase
VSARGATVRAIVLASLTVAAGCGRPCALDAGIDGATCGTLTAMALPKALPADPTSAHADDYAAAVLGFHIFFDARFSQPHNVRCASCHAPENHFDDDLPQAVGIAQGTRNAPSTLNAAWQSRFMWDGRFDVLWAPPVGAMENPLEMDFTRLEIAHAVAQYFADKYMPIFGALPPLDDATRFPARGKPGDAAFDGMAPADQDAVNRVAANVGKSLAAYLRKQASGPSPFDRYLGGERTALSDHQQLGMLLFVQAGCANCHSGPQLTDGEFHNLGVPGDSAMPDRGRAAGIALERAQTFTPDGPYADAPRPLIIADATPADEGAFRTPTLRNIVLTAPYMHNGAFATLDAAVAFHLRGGGRGAGGFVGQVDAKLQPYPLAPDDRAALVDFLSALTGAPPEAPWNQWQDIP